MKSKILNRFNATAIPFRFPKEISDKVHRFVQQHQSGKSVAEQAPFRRQLDLWAMGVAVACAEGFPPRNGPSSSWGKKFVDTRSVQISADLADLLMILAVSELGIADEKLEEASEVMEVANCFAAVGVPHVLKWLDDPDLRQTNIEKVITRLRKLEHECLNRAGYDNTSDANAEVVSSGQTEATKDGSQESAS